MSKIRITGELHGDTKTITVNAADEVEAINKIKAKFPDFEVAHETNTLIDNSYWEAEPMKQPVRKSAVDSKESLELLKQIEKNTRITARLARVLFVLIAIILAVFVFSFAVGLGSGSL